MSGLNSLKSLHTALIDAMQGYEMAIESAESREIKTVFEEMRLNHRRAHADVDALLRAKGETPDESGSFMSTVHKTVIAVRSATTGLDYSSLKSFADGEERNLKAYDDAIQESAGDKLVVDKLTPHRHRLIGMIARMKDESVE